MSNQEDLAKNLILKLKENLNVTKKTAQKNFSTFSGYNSETIALKKIVDVITRAEEDLNRNCSFDKKD